MENHMQRPAGWRTMPYIMGTEICARVALAGLQTKFLLFLITQFNMEPDSASNVISIWNLMKTLAPLIGAFVSDTYVGKFWTTTSSSFAFILGMLSLTLVAWISELHPCSPQCTGPNKPQIGLIFMILGFFSIGMGGVIPCSVPFCIDQFDKSTEEGRRGIINFYNWYYAYLTTAMTIAVFVISYIQYHISWAIGFGIQTTLMVGGIILYFLGSRLYIRVMPEKSVFSGLVQVLVAAYKKRNVNENGRKLYDPPITNPNLTRLSLTNQFRCLNKAVVIIEGDITPEDHVAKPWKLASIQQVEQLKCLIRIFPIWVSGTITFMATILLRTFTDSQVLEMNRHIGLISQVSLALLPIMFMITVVIGILIYATVAVPNIRKITKVDGGVTLLQRMGIGLVFSVLSVVTSGLVERLRRSSAIGNDTKISILWIAPQLILMGFAEALNTIGQLQFYNQEFPESMSCVANSIFASSMSVAGYLAGTLVNIVRDATRTEGHPGWLPLDLNVGRLEDFYFLIAGIMMFNLLYFLCVSHWYNYKK